MAHHPHVYSTEAITLRRTDFGEADRILTLFTPTYGKVRAIAKGARRTTSRLAGHLEPFTRTQLLLATDATSISSPRPRGANGWMRCATTSGTPRRHGISPNWWIASSKTPTRIRISTPLCEDAAPTQRERGHARTTRSWLALRYFELHLLNDLGFRPNLHHCVNCDRPLRPEENSYSAELGGALCPNCRHLGQRRITLNALKVLRLLQASTWEATPKLRLEPDLQGEMEDVLQSTLRYHLDRELKSWAFLQKAPTR